MKRTGASKYLVHNNADLLCAVDVETTGLIAGFHDIWQICVLPLDSFYEPLKETLPFYMELIPERGNLDPKAVSMDRYNHAKVYGLHPFAARDRFQEWFGKLGLAFQKRIRPLAHNWPFDRSFLIDWLGQDDFDQFFDYHYRDSMAAALFCNDCHDLWAEQTQYSKYNLKWLSTTMSIPNEMHHDAMNDCLVTAAVYKEMMRRLK